MSSVKSTEEDHCPPQQQRQAPPIIPKLSFGNRISVPTTVFTTSVNTSITSTTTSSPEKSTVEVSVLLSLGGITLDSTSTSYQRTPTTNTDLAHDPSTLTTVISKVCSSLGVKPEQVDLFELLNLPPSAHVVDGARKGLSTLDHVGVGQQGSLAAHFGVQLKSEKMSVDYFKHLIMENKRLETKVEKAAEALITLQLALKKLPNTNPEATTLTSPLSITSISPAGVPALAISSTTSTNAPLTPTAGGRSSSLSVTPGRYGALMIGGSGGTSPRVPAYPSTGGTQLSPRTASSATVATPSTLLLAHQVKKLEAANEALNTELEELRQKQHRSECFKQEVLQTVKELKRQLAVLTEELMMNESLSWSTEDQKNS